MELGQLIGPEMRELLREDPLQARDLMEEFHPQDVSECIEQLEDELAARAINVFPLDYAAEVFGRLDEERRVAIAEQLGRDATVRLVAEMDADDAVDFFSQLPDQEVEALLERLQEFDPETAQDVQELTRWPEHSAGGLMNNWFVEVSEEAQIDDAIAELRAQASEGVEVLDIVFVLDQQGRVSGYVTLRMLLMAKPKAAVTDIMQHNLVSVPPELDQEEVARTFARYDLNALPVVDQEGRILGVITADDVIDVVEEEAEEDAQRMGAIEPMESAYFAVPFWTYLRKRAPWLMILFIGGFFTTSAMEAFSPVLQAVTQLAFYVPLLISAGGNSGSQSATLVIRGLAVGDIQARDWTRVAKRELIQGLTIGVILAAMGIGRAALAGDSVAMAGLIGATIIAIVTLGCLVGGMMPLLLDRIGFDPATSSTPFIATLIDVLGIVVYLGLARWLLVSAHSAALSGG